MSTEFMLREWRSGSINAERLCAGILAVDGFRDIDPQAPLGGGDDRKDILARRDGLTYLAAVFFPSTITTRAGVKRKYIEDRTGFPRHGADRFIFMVNQHVTIGERTELLRLGSTTDTIYHLERIASILNSPPGYSLRLQYLGIPMTAEDQIAFFSTLGSNERVERLVRDRAIVDSLDSLEGRTIDILKEVRRIARSTASDNVVGNIITPISTLDIATLLLIHSAVTESSGMPDQVRGSLRTIRTWIMGNRGTAHYDTAPPEQIVERLEELLIWWRKEYAIVSIGRTQEVVVRTLARLHFGLVKIHPFADGNGRVARFVLDAAARELLSRGIGTDLTQDRLSYYESLVTGHEGDLSQLETLIAAALK